MNLGTSQTLFATGHFSDDIDISDQTLWLSSDNTIANISNAGTYRGGVVTALSSGTVTISASHNGISATSNISVTNNPNVAASISFLASPNVILNNGTDNSNITITLQPANSTSGIADNTEIEIQITEGDTITNQTISTTDGSASFNLSSNYEGFNEIKASIPDSNISLSSNIFSTSSFIALSLARVLNILSMLMMPSHCNQVAGLH